MEVTEGSVDGQLNNEQGGQPVSIVSQHAPRPPRSRHAGAVGQGSSGEAGANQSRGRAHRFRARFWGHHSPRQPAEPSLSKYSVLGIPDPEETDEDASHAERQGLVPVSVAPPSHSLTVSSTGSPQQSTALSAKPSTGRMSDIAVETLADRQRESENESAKAAQIEASEFFLDAYQREKERRANKRAVRLPLPKVLTRNELTSRLPSNYASTKKRDDLAVYHSSVNQYRRFGSHHSVESKDLLRKDPERRPSVQRNFWKNHQANVIPPDRNPANEGNKTETEEGNKRSNTTRWYLDDVGSAMDVMMDLRTDQMHSLKLEFDRAPHEQGVTLVEFVSHLKRKLPKEVTESEETIAGLIELFHEIDLNGDGYVGWDEFTSFVTESASVTSDRFVVEDLRKYEASHVVDDTVHDLGIERVDYIRELDRLVTCERNHSIQVYAATDCRLLKQIPMGKGSPVAVSFIPPLNCIVVATSDLHLTLFDSITYRRRGRFALKEAVTSIAYDPMYQSLFTGSSTGVVTLWRLGPPADAPRGSHALELTEVMSLSPGHSGAVMDIKVVPDLGALVTCSLDSTLRLWDLRTGSLKRTLRGHTKGVLCLAYATDYKVLISAGFDHSAIVWNPFVEGLMFRLKGHQNPLVGCLWVPFTPQVITIDASGIINVWDVRSMECVHSSDAKLTEITSLAYCDTNERLVLLGSASRSLSFMDYARPHHPEKADEHPVLCAMYNPLTLSIVTVAERTIKLWDCKTGTLSQAYRNVTKAQITAACLDDRNRKIFVGDAEGHIVCINFANGAFIKNLVSHEAEVSSLSYCAAERCVLSTSWDRTVIIHDESDIRKGHQLLRLHGHTSDVTSASFSSRLLLIASGAVDGGIHIWDFTDGTLDGVCKSKDPDEITCVQFFSHKPLLLSADSGGQVILWAMPPLVNKYSALITLRSEEHMFNGPAPVISMCFSEEEKCLFAGDERGYIHMWDVTEALESINVTEFVDIERSVARPYNATYKGKPAKRGTKTLNPILRSAFTAHVLPDDFPIPATSWYSESDVVSHLELCSDTVTEIVLITASQDRQVQAWGRSGESFGRLQQLSERELLHRGMVDITNRDSVLSREWKFPLDIDGRKASDHRMVQEIESKVDAINKKRTVKDRLRHLRTSMKEDAGHHSEELWGGAYQSSNTFMTELHAEYDRRVDLEGGLHYEDEELERNLDRSQLVEPFIEGKLMMPNDPEKMTKLRSDKNSMEIQYQITQLCPFYSSHGRRAEDSVKAKHLPPHALAVHKQRRLSKLPEIPRLYSAKDRASFWNRLNSDQEWTPKKLGARTSRF